MGVGDVLVIGDSWTRDVENAMGAGGLMRGGGGDGGELGRG